jgi:hypothetical protein
MRPDCEHIVYTLEDTIVTGGHFYAATTLEQSMWSGLREHLFGRTSTNAEHLASEAILHRLMCYYRHVLELVQDDPSVER